MGVGDDAGSRVVTARLVRAGVHLGFVLERRWPPYPDWAGTAFTALREALEHLVRVHPPPPAARCARTSAHRRPGESP
ncbi:DUF4037 domain-containing protein [Kineococcus arenarius]|uniref:DUF4037 domain-containing protein n=1 Tax=unclassified Kineococcus TaxID=2621656 RepID=UPI003D7E9BEE